jgi:hypothetical protein
MEATKKNYVIGESSQRLLIALEKYHEFQDSLIDAYNFMYGEEWGNEYFSRVSDKLDEIERTAIMEYLRVNFVTEMGLGKDTINL